MVSAKLILIGETGNGKSSLGNFILGRKAFSVSSNPKAETKITKGERTQNEKDDIFVIDTPGLQDSEGADKEHLVQMVDYIKSNPGLQSIVIVLNYHQPRLALYIKTLIRLLCNVFPGSDFWSHVALVWTKYYYYLPPEEKSRSSNVVSTFMPEVLELVQSTNGDCTINSFPTFFVDSNLEKKDEFSCEEIKRLLAWTHHLSPIDVTKVKEADPKIKEIVVEKDVRVTKNVVKNIEHIKKEYYERNKEIHYDGHVSYSNWVKVKEENHDNVLPRKLLTTKIEKKEEKHVHDDPIIVTRRSSGNWVTGISFGIAGPKPRTWQERVGTNRTTTTDYYEREIKIYNDDSVEEGNWRKVNTKRNTVRV